MTDDVGRMKGEEGKGKEKRDVDVGLVQVAASQDEEVQEVVELRCG